MAFDGIVTAAMASELRRRLLSGKIDKIHQPVKEELVITVHTASGNVRLFASVRSSDTRVHLIEGTPSNPPAPSSFCMLLRKHLTGARIISIEQKGSERIIEFSLETVSELGFTLTKKLIFEIMGKHSNVILVDAGSGKIIDSIKRVSIDTSRARQVLPGLAYEYPPLQDKIPFREITDEQLLAIDSDPKAMLASVGGISPAFAAALAYSGDRVGFLRNVIGSAESGGFTARVYRDGSGRNIDYHIADLPELESSCSREDFKDLSSCIDAFFSGKAVTNLVRQNAGQLSRTVRALYDKACLKKQRLAEEKLSAEDSDYLRLYGELLTANINKIPHGASSVRVSNYYDGSEVEIPLDPRFSPSKNTQMYFKKYGKAKTAIKEKTAQLEETQQDIDYLESVLTFLDQTNRPEDVEAIRSELIEAGYLRKRRNDTKQRRVKFSPHRYVSPSGFEILAGRNNRENDELTLRVADKTDIWLHTKDIPGSHVILRTHGGEPTAEDIYCAASVAAYYSKASASSNVPVDYVPVRHVKKPGGAKPGMVIFTGNRAVYVDPKLPSSTCSL